MTGLGLACIALLLQDADAGEGLRVDLKLSHTGIRRTSIDALKAVIRLENAGAKPLYLSVAHWEQEDCHGNEDCEWVVNGAGCRREPFMWCMDLRLEPIHFILLAPGEIREREVSLDHVEFTSDGTASIQYRFKSLRAHPMWDESAVRDLASKAATVTVLSNEASLIFGDDDVLAPAPAVVAPKGAGRLQIDGRLTLGERPRIEVRISNPGVDEIDGPNLRDATWCESCLAGSLRIEVQTQDGKDAGTLPIGFQNAKNPCRGKKDDEAHVAKFTAGADARAEEFFDALKDLREGCYRLRPVLAVEHGGPLTGEWKPFGWIPPAGK